jgi:hypothetical protein
MINALQISADNGQVYFLPECSSKQVKALYPELYFAQVAREIAVFRMDENWSGDSGRCAGPRADSELGMDWSLNLFSPEYLSRAEPIINDPYKYYIYIYVWGYWYCTLIL